jgi:lipoprotein-anchoring transpeptidase ErfK/SrfK
MEPLRKRLGLASRRVLVVTGLAIALLALGSAAATARVKSSSDQLLNGMRIDGVDVGGMTREQALAAVQRDVTPKLHNQVAVTVKGQHFTVTPAQLGRAALVTQTVDRAMAGPRLPWIARLWHRVSGQSVDHDVSLAYNDNSAQVASFVASVAGKVDRPVQDATIKLVNGSVEVQHARTGWSLDQSSSRSMVASALAAGHAARVALPARVIHPRVTDRQAGTTITVNTGANQLTLYKGLKVEKRYRVATAKAGFSTPKGTWKVIDKIVNPSWHNPAPNGWGAGMPLVIPPGPGNPLGTRALRLNSPGILIHGTFNPASIGTYASHGCIRMRIADSIDLFPRVPTGAKVLVYRG